MENPSITLKELDFAGIGLSNIRYHENDVITFTNECIWLPRDMLMDHGWGNGYIAIPLSHPFMKNISPVIKEYKKEDGDFMDATFDVTMDILNDKYPIENQEWTYSRPRTINGEDYYVFGFDTAHIEQTPKNWPESRIVNTIEDYVKIVNNENKN